MGFASGYNSIRRFIVLNPYIIIFYYISGVAALPLCQVVPRHSFFGIVQDSRVSRCEKFWHPSLKIPGRPGIVAPYGALAPRNKLTFS